MIANSRDHARSRKKRLLRWCPALVICATALILAPWLLGPKCPDRIVIATGDSTGAYFRFAQEYKEVLAKSGITLDVLSTAGSVENENLLRSESSDVAMALIQGGVSDGDRPGLQSLASLYQEPVWLFSRKACSVNSIEDLKGRKIAVGRQGSGTRPVATRILNVNGIQENDATWVDHNAKVSCEKLLNGEIDAAFIVIAPESAIVEELIRSDSIELFSFDRASAYQRQFPFLSKTVLPEGLVDFSLNLPQRDVCLLAPTANLVVREDFHHALVPLVLEAVQKVHDKHGMLVQDVQFPTPRYTEFPLNRDAERYFQSGPSFLYRYLPFSLAAWLDRVKLVLLPMCTILIPLVKAAPPFYRWRIRSRIYRWYRVLHEVDLERESATNDEQRRGLQRRLERLEQELFEISVPLSYMEEFYNLRLHAAFVRSKISNVSKDASANRQKAA